MTSTTEDYDVRLVAFTPWTVGGQLGPLPMPLSFTYTNTRHGIPQLVIEYKDGTPRAELLDQPCEVAVQYLDTDGTFTEGDFSRFLVVKREWDRVDKTNVKRYTCLGLGWILARMKIFDATEVDEGDGPQAPLRRWLDPMPGQMLVPTFNAAVARCFESITVPLSDPPEKVFEISTDGNDEPWAETIPGEVFRRTTEPISNLLDLCVQTGIAEARWFKRQFWLLNFGTYGDDLSDSVILRDAHGITSSPEVKD